SACGGTGIATGPRSSTLYSHGSLGHRFRVQKAEENYRGAPGGIRSSLMSEPWTFRRATTADTEEILELLRISLGEETIPWNRKFWDWKHIENPFGISPAGVAVSGTSLV